MKTWVKVAIGVGTLVAAGLGVAFLGKKHNDNADYVEIDVETEDCDSDSDEEAE